MTEINSYAPGRFCWLDLATTNADGAKKFYTGLFGWRTHDIPVGPGAFTMCRLDGKAVASLYQLSQQHRAQGVPAHWMPYVAVTNVDETAALAAPLGGQVLVDPFNVTDLGRMALVLDPTGVPFALWQAGRHSGSELMNQAGTLTWVELVTPEFITATRFYTQLFGWQIQNPRPGQISQAIFLDKGRQVAGVRSMATAWGDILPQWRIGFGVADYQAGIERAEELGGAVVGPPVEWSSDHRSTLIKDPQGATFTIIWG